MLQLAALLARTGKVKALPPPCMAFQPSLVRQVAEAEVEYEEAAARLEARLGARHATTITAKINLAVGERG